MEPHVMKINGNDFTLLVSADGKEQAIVLPSELSDPRALSAESKGRLIAIPSPANLHTQHQVQTSCQNPTLVSVTSAPSNVTGWNEKELSNWAPKLGTDLDSKWLQRNEIDYLVSQPAVRNENQASQQVFNTVKTQDMGNTYIPVHLQTGMNVPLVAKVDPQSLRQRLTSVTLKPTGIHNDSLVTSKVMGKDLLGATKNVILVSRGQVAAGVPQNTMGRNIHGKSEAGNLVHYLGQGLSIKTLDMTKATHEQSVVSPVYKSKLEKAIAQSNLNNNTNSQNLTGTSEQRTSQGTLKQLLNTGEYKLKLNPNIHVSQTVNKNIGMVTSSMQETCPMTSLLDANIIQQRITDNRNPTNLNIMNIVKKKPLKTKLKEQNILLANDVNKTYMQSENSHVSTLGNQPLGISSIVPLSKPEPDKLFRNVTPTYKVQSQIIMNKIADTTTCTPITCTSLVQLNPTPPVTSNSSVHTFVKPQSLDVSQKKAEVIEEKEYIDNGLARDILDTMWQLREKDLFCDAVIFAEDKQVKLHKIVLAGVSAAMHRKVVESHGVELLLLLPEDITYNNLLLFVSYLYLGRLLLTVENVQQLYRLSGLFSVEQLKKYCYEFCKLSKMGHLIISCPYQEAAKQVLDVSKSATQPSSSTAPAKEKPGISSETPPVTEQTTGPQTNKQTPPIKTHSKKEVKTTDIDWMNSDPSQSNIPIRKRGRTRKGLTSPGGGGNPDIQSDIPCNTNVLPEKSTDEVKGNQPNVQDVAKKDLSKPRSVVPKKKATARETQKSKDTTLEDNLAQQLTELPDPLATGKIDESELLKIVPTLQKGNEANSLKSSKPTPGKSMVTRFRNRPKNMSVIEAAAQKKAKSNDTSSLYSSKSPPKNKGKGKKQPNGASVAKWPKSAEKVKFELDKPEVKEPPKQKSRTEKSPVLAEMLAKKQIILAGMLAKQQIITQESQMKVTHSVPAKSNKENHKQPNTETASFSNSDIKSNQGNKDTDPFHTSPQMDAKLSPDETTNRKRPLEEASDLVINMAETFEQSMEQQTQSDQQTPVSPPKKARQRKMPVDQPDGPKDTVYMRPPPKKRTKEIREMMRNEDVMIEEEKNMAAIESLIQFPENNIKEVVEEAAKTVQTGEEKKIIVKKSRKKFVKDDMLMQQVYDIELSGKMIEGEKQYKCCLCNNVFIFARRAVTHLLNTHDICLDESYQHVVVEPRNSAPIVCDICGYKTKEVNVYYIHYHKYFRHGVPLPKGWQPFTCDLCKKEFFTKFQLREHKLIHFEDNPFVCEHCGSGFKSRTCLNSHVFHKHSSVRRHACNQCPKTFKTATQLKVHKRIHSGDKPFACTDLQCSYRSTTRGNMRLHLINRHKYTNDHTKDIMITLQPSHPPPPKADAAPVEDNTEDQTQEEQTHEWMDSGQDQANEDRAMAMASDPATLTTLVEAAVAEVNNAGGYSVPNLNEATDVQEHGMTTVLPSVESMANQLIDQNQAANQSRREYDMSLVHQASMVQGISYVGQDHCESLTGHVPMTVQVEQDMHHNSNILMQHDDQNGGNMQGYDQNINQHSMIVIPHQDYSDQELASTSQNYNLPQEPRLETTHSHQIPLKTRLDPGSREARMIVKQALQGHEPRTLLKAAILKGSINSGKLMRSTNDNVTLSLDTRSMTGDHLPQSIHQFADDSALVIDTQTHQDPQLVMDVDQVDNSVQEHFRGAHSNTMFRGGHEVNLTNHPQHQGLDPQHLQSFQSSSMAPPLSYSSSSHSLITAIPVSELPTSHTNMTLTSVDQGHFQGEDVHHGQVQPGYDNNVVQSQVNTSVSSDGNVYVGYYQQHFPIENY